MSPWPPRWVTTANSTAALVTIAEVRPIKVSFTLPQSDLSRIQARQQTGKLLATLVKPVNSLSG